MIQDKDDHAEILKKKHKGKAFDLILKYKNKTKN